MSSEGKWINRCSSKKVESLERCKAFCTHQTSCIGINYRNKSRKRNHDCFLFLSSDDTCPMGWNHSPGKLVNTMKGSKLSRSKPVSSKSGQGMIPSWTDGHDCYGKTSGRCILYLEQ